MKKKIIVTITGLMAAALLFTGCDASKQVKSAVEHSHEVVVQGQVVLDIVTGKLEGSEVWNEVEAYVVSLDNALASMEVALERIAPWVGADLEDDVEIPTETVFADDVEAVIQLDQAVQALNESIK